YPLTWVRHPEYLWVTTGAALLTAFIAPIMKHLRQLFFWLDALGLVVFTIIGCNVARQMELPLTVVLVSGMITGCAGGVLRDVLCNDIPLLFRSELYASVSLLTGVIYLGLLHLARDFGQSHNAAVVVALIAGLALRML